MSAESQCRCTAAQSKRATAGFLDRTRPQCRTRVVFDVWKAVGGALHRGQADMDPPASAAATVHVPGGVSDVSAPPPGLVPEAAHAEAPAGAGSGAAAPARTGARSDAVPPGSAVEVLPSVWGRADSVDDGAHPPSHAPEAAGGSGASEGGGSVGGGGAAEAAEAAGAAEAAEARPRPCVCGMPWLRARVPPDSSAERVGATLLAWLLLMFVVFATTVVPMAAPFEPA